MKRDKDQMAFSIPLGHPMMPFGLANAPEVSHCHINDVMRDVLDIFVFCVYLKYIIIGSN